MGFRSILSTCQMLEYLGYDDEAEFVADIDGMVSNCMHPDDRSLVDASVACQMKAGRGIYRGTTG